MKLPMRPGVPKRCRWCKTPLLWYVVPSGAAAARSEGFILEFCTFCDQIHTGDHGEQTQRLDGR